MTDKKGFIQCSTLFIRAVAVFGAAGKMVAYLLIIPLALMVRSRLRLSGPIAEKTTIAHEPARAFCVDIVAKDLFRVIIIIGSWFSIVIDSFFCWLANFFSVVDLINFSDQSSSSFVAKQSQAQTLMMRDPDNVNIVTANEEALADWFPSGVFLSFSFTFWIWLGLRFLHDYFDYVFTYHSKTFCGIMAFLRYCANANMNLGVAP